MSPYSFPRSLEGSVMNTPPMFSMTDEPIPGQEPKADLHAPEAGAYVEFEGHTLSRSY